MLEGTSYARVRDVEHGEGSYAPQAGPARQAYRMDPHELGRKGEAAAADYLERLGWEILERNWRWDYGEVDIVAHAASTPESCATFVEVKTRMARRGDDEPAPEAAVDHEKRRRYVDAARHYMMLHPRFESVRFDAVAITAWEGGGAHLHHVMHAFGMER